MLLGTLVGNAAPNQAQDVKIVQLLLNMNLHGSGASALRWTASSVPHPGMPSLRFSGRFWETLRPRHP